MWIRVDLFNGSHVGGLTSDMITGTICPNILNALQSAAAAAAGLHPVFKVPAWPGNPGSGAVCNLADPAAQVQCICAGSLAGWPNSPWFEFNVMWSEMPGVQVSDYAALLTKAFFRAAKIPCGTAANPVGVAIASYGSCTTTPDPTYWGPDQGGCSFGFNDKAGYLLPGSGACLRKAA